MLKSFLTHFRQLGLLAVAAIGLLAARPLFTPCLPHGTDTLTHFYTLIQLNHLMQQGIFYSRWLPYRAGGLGTPLFHYYAPLAYYLAQGFYLLSPEPLLALRLAWGLALVGGALGMYLWARDLLDEIPALVAVAAYICGPYALFTAFFRGGFAEQFALMFMPLTLWAFRRLAVTGQARYLAMSAITYAALILSHNVTALIFSPVLLAYNLILTRDRASLLHLGKNWWRALGMLLATMGLGFGLSSFFWLPILVERNAIVADMLYSLPGLDYRQHFVPFNRLLSLPFITSPGPGLSLITVALALIGLGHIWLTSRTRPTPSSGAATAWFFHSLTRHSLFAALMAAACIVMALPVSVWLWEMIPALRFLQFPQRFLGVASLFVAFLAGVGAASLRQRFNRTQATGLLLLITALLLGHTWGLDQARYYPPLPVIDVNFTMQKEREVGLANTVYSGNFIPATVKTLPSLAQLAQNGPDRLDLAALPAGAQVIAAGFQPLRYELRLSSPRPFVARFHTFYFPGWQAQLDGQPAPITPSDPHGLIGVELPAGEHRLIIWFGSTPIRTLANILTASSAVMLGLAMVMIWLHNPKKGK